MTTRESITRDADPAPWWKLAAQRWPSLAGLAVAYLAVNGAAGADLAPLVALLPVGYVVAEVTRRPWTIWIVVAALFVVVPVTQRLGPEHAALVRTLTIGVVLTTLAVSALVLVLRKRKQEIGIQAVGLIIFGTIAVVAFFVPTSTAVLLLGVGLIGHGLWDIWHLIRGKVVPRQFAEFCAVLDIPAGLAYIWIAGRW